MDALDQGFGTVARTHKQISRDSVDDVLIDLLFLDS